MLCPVAPEARQAIWKLWYWQYWDVSTNDAWCWWGTTVCETGVVGVDTLWSHLTAARQRTFHKRHSSVLRSTMIQKTTTKSLVQWFITKSTSVPCANTLVEEEMLLWVHHPHVARRHEGHDMVVSSEVDLQVFTRSCWPWTKADQRNILPAIYKHQCQTGGLVDTNALAHVQQPSAVTNAKCYEMGFIF